MNYGIIRRNKDHSGVTAVKLRKPLEDRKYGIGFSQRDNQWWIIGIIDNRVRTCHVRKGVFRKAFGYVLDAEGYYIEPATEEEFETMRMFEIPVFTM